MSNKLKPEDLKKLDYNIQIEKENYEDEKWYIAYAKELGKYSCYGKGDTPEEAVHNFLKEKDQFIEDLYQQGLPVPLPENSIDTESFSGVFNVRTSPLIHAKLVYQAKQQGISLNLYLNQILSAHVSKVQTESEILKLIQEQFIKDRKDRDDFKSQIQNLTNKFAEHFALSKSTIPGVQQNEKYNKEKYLQIA